MKVILLDNVIKLGIAGTEVVVKPGYARNFLIPKFKAMLATEKNVEFVKSQQIALKRKMEEKKLKAKSCMEIINKIGSIKIEARAGVEGRLFGSINARYIAEKITNVSGFKISKFQIRLPNNDALKTVGTHKISIHIYNGVVVDLNVIVVDS